MLGHKLNCSKQVLMQVTHRDEELEERTPWPQSMKLYEAKNYKFPGLVSYSWYGLFTGK